MPACNNHVEIRQTKEPTDEAFVIRCVLSEGHDDECSAYVWVLSENLASGTKGVFKPIYWKSD
jgi:hypothetical protein